MRKIVDLQLADLRSRMDEGKHLNLDVTTAAKDYIIDSAYDSVFGARPIKTGKTVENHFSTRAFPS